MSRSSMMRGFVRATYPRSRAARGGCETDSIAADARAAGPDADNRGPAWPESSVATTSAVGEFAFTPVRSSPCVCHDSPLGPIAASPSWPCSRRCSSPSVALLFV
jgi:hypothetical protein